MCLLNYNFMVLDNAFLIHQPGVKRKSQNPVQSKVAENEVKLLKKELTILLGKKSGCQ